MSARSVTFIPATTGRLAPVILGTPDKKRVAAYARVSTDNEEQLSSFDAQMDYYTKKIQSNEAWDFVEVYTDEGISATSTKKRDGFKRMISDALNGKIDLIITKSVSRFARNTVDTLTTVRQLKEKGVEVFFEKENIYTLDSKGELLITIMSSLAQEESRSISENVTWGQRKRFADGKVSLPYKRFLGYEKGEDGVPKIVEKEAEVVRLIYKMFLGGKTPATISRHLTNNGIPTPAGKVKWNSSTVVSILTNEKYKGDAILQKKFTVDFLTKKTKVNEGEVPQYYVNNSHLAIIEPEVFDLVQHEMEKRKCTGRHQSGISCFSSRIICGQCGSFYGSKVWHSTSKYRRVVWQCNNKFKNDTPCQTPHFYEDTLKQAFADVFNSLIENKHEVISVYDDIVRTLTDNTALEAKSATLQKKCDALFEQMRQCVDENAHKTLDQNEYQRRYSGLLNQYEATKRKHDQITNEKQERITKHKNISLFLRTLDQNSTLLAEFDEELWYSMVDTVSVHSEHNLTFTFKDGTKRPWII